MVDQRRQPPRKQKASFSRVTNDHQTNPSFDKLGYVVDNLQNQIDILDQSMSTMLTNSIGQPSPQIPFILSERADTDGYYETIAVNVPPNTEELHLRLIRRSENQKKASDATDQAAIDRAHRVAETHHTYNLQVAEDQATAGVFVGEIGPFKLREGSNVDLNRWQLVRLVALNNGNRNKNPAMSPYDLTPPIAAGTAYPDFPHIIDTLVVRNSGISPQTPPLTDDKYWTLGAAVNGISVPSTSLIVCNKVNKEGHGGTSKLTFKVWADSANTGIASDKTFADKGITTIHIAVPRLNADNTSDPGSGTSTDSHRHGGAVDTTATFTLIDVELSTGVKYLWAKNIANNGAHNQPVTPPSPVRFIAGNGTDVSNLTIGLTATHKNVHFARLDYSLQQPGTPGTESCGLGAVLIKKVELWEDDTGEGYKGSPNKAIYNVVKERSYLHKNDANTVGALTNGHFKVKTKAKKVGLYSWFIRVTQAGFKSDLSDNTKDSAIITYDSSMTVVPALPTIDDIVLNELDGDRSHNRAKMALRVWVNQAAKDAWIAAGKPTTGSSSPVATSPSFSGFNVDNAGFAMRRVKPAKGDQNTNSDPTPSDTTPTSSGAQTYHHHHLMAIPDADLGLCSTIVEVHDLHYGKLYEIYRTIEKEHGVHSKSAITSVQFYAGFGAVGAFDPSRLITPTLSVMRVNKRYSRIFIDYTQPPPTGSPIAPPVLIKGIEFYQRLAGNDPMGNPYIWELLHTRDARKHPGLSSNTDPGDLPNPPNTVTPAFRRVHYKAHHPDSMTGIKYYGVIRAEGDAVVYVGSSFGVISGSVTVPGTGTGGNMATVTGANFTTNFAVDDFILIGTELKRITLINSAVLLTVESPFMLTYTAQPYSRLRPFTDTDTGNGAPANPPGSPRAADIIENTITGDTAMGHATVVFRIYCSAASQASGGTNGESFQSVGADSAHAIVILPGDPVTGNAKRHRYRIGGPVVDVTAPYMDVSSPVLTVGKAYIWELNQLGKNGANTASAMVSIMFTAGGNIGAAGLPVIANPPNTGGASGGTPPALVLQTINRTGSKTDGRHLHAELRFCNQPYTDAVTGLTAKTLLKRVEFDKTITPSGSASFTKTAIKHRRLLDNPNYNNPVGPSYSVSPFITETFQVPPGAAVTITARIYGVSDTAGVEGNSYSISASTTSASEQLFEDNGAPVNDGGRTTYLRWRNAGIRANCLIPVGLANNMVTHTRNQVIFYFRIAAGALAGQYYLWNPILKTTAFTASVFPTTPPDFTSISVAPFLIDLGKGASISLNNQVPTTAADNTGEIDATTSTVFDAISITGTPSGSGGLGGGTLTCYFITYNLNSSGVEVGTGLTFPSITITGLGVGSGWKIDRTIPGN